MKVLKPDSIVWTVELENPAELEKFLHKKFKNKRLPQSEYFRLSTDEVTDASSKMEEAGTEYVYLIRNGEDYYRIGRTGDLERRMKVLKPQRIVCTVKLENSAELVKRLHRKFAHRRPPHTDTFRLSADEATDAISEMKRAETEIKKAEIWITTNIKLDNSAGEDPEDADRIANWEDRSGWEILKGRMKKLKPFNKPFNTLYSIHLDNADRIENVLRRKFADKRVPQTDYFRLTEEEVQQAIAVCELNIPRRENTEPTKVKPTRPTEASVQRLRELQSLDDDKSRAADQAAEKKLKWFWYIGIPLAIYAFAC